MPLKHISPDAPKPREVHNVTGIGPVLTPAEASHYYARAGTPRELYQRQRDEVLLALKAAEDAHPALVAAAEDARGSFEASSKERDALSAAIATTKAKLDAAKATLGGAAADAILAGKAPTGDASEVVRLTAALAELDRRYDHADHAAVSRLSDAETAVAQSSGRIEALRRQLERMPRPEAIHWPDAVSGVAGVTATADGGSITTEVVS